MTDKTYLVRLKPRELGLHVVVAASAEIHGEHIVLLNSDGKLANWLLCSCWRSLKIGPRQDACRLHVQMEQILKTMTVQQAAVFGRKP